MDAFQAIADSVRRDLLQQLVAGPLRVVDLAAGRDISRPAVSRHLRLLSEAGLVHGQDRGRERHYQLDTQPLVEVQELISSLGASIASTPEIAFALDALETEVHRASRDRRDGITITTPDQRTDTA